MESLNELFNKVLSNTTDEIYVQNPCKVVDVHGNYVDILLYINDDEPDFIIYNVPIKRPETQRAYIFLGIKKGDRGVCRFFDRSVEGYLQSDFDYNSDERQHDINDRCFELGFIPDAESYVYPSDKEIEIGLKNKSFKLSVDNEGNMVIYGQDLKLQTEGMVTLKADSGLQVTAPDATFSGNVNVGTGESAVVPTGGVTLTFSNGILTGVS